jgi:hypothetical protein
VGCVSASKWDPILGEDDGIDIARELDGLSGFRSAPTGTPRQTNSAGNIKSLWFPESGIEPMSGEPSV